MRFIKKVIPFIITVSIIISTMSPFVVLGADKTEYIFSETFNEGVTNKECDNVIVSGALSRIIESGPSNKVLQVLSSELDSSVSVNFKTSENKYMISMDISGDSKISGYLGLKSGNTDVKFLVIKQNSIRTIEGKVICGINSDKFTNLAVSINKKKGKFSLYVDGQRVLTDWNMNSLTFDAFYFLRTYPMTESLYIDNILIYPGDQLIENIPYNRFNEEKVEFIPIVDDLGDFCFFNSNYITHRYTGYPNTSLYPKTNEIICEKFDHYNPNKGDRIILKKTTTDDCYFDVTTKIFSNYLSSKVYKYFTVAADIMCDISGAAGAQAFLLRDTQSTGSQINLVSTEIHTDGSLTLLGGKKIKNIAKKGQWFNLRIYINLITHKMDIFVNGKLEAEGVSFTSDFNTLNLVRFNYRSGEGSGEIHIRNMEVTGLDKPFEGEEIKTSMFSDDGVIKEYLANKTCFHFYGQNIYSNGTKKSMSVAPIYENNELYISETDFNAAFGVEVKFNENRAVLDNKEIILEKGTKLNHDKLLVPVKETSEKLLQKFTFDDTNGMILVADEPMYFDLESEVPYHKRKYNIGYIDRFSNIQYLNDFLLFDRPSRERLLEDFNKFTDNGRIHPRIMATREDFENIIEKSKTDEYLKFIVDEIISMADADVKAAPITYKFDDNLRTLNTANRFRDRMQRLGFAYQITGDQKYVDAAWENFKMLATFPDLNPGHPIDVGSYTNGMAIGYDWMYHGFTEEQRAVISEAAIRLGITVLNNGFYGRTPARGGNDGNVNLIGLYNKWISNYNAWVNHGSMLAALAFMEEAPELCTDLLWHSLRSSEYTLKNFYPDGAWVESTSYWSIAAGCLAYEILALNKIYGTDFNLSKFPGFSEAGIFIQTMHSPVGAYNYHDAWESTEFSPYPVPFFGVYFNQPELLAARKMAITKALDGMTAAKPTIFDALLYRSDININDVTKLPRVHVARGLESFAVHENYLDFNGLFLACHAGPVTTYHSQNDNGDFVLDLLGERWACALPPEDYNSSLSNSEKYRYRTEGHNTVTLNNGPTLNQLGGTFAPIIKWEENTGGAYCVYDMSEMYADADEYLRGFYVGDNYRSVTIRDEFKLNKDTEIYWFMHTTAQAFVIDKNTVLLSKNGKSVVLTFKTNAPSSNVSIMDAVPLPSSPKGEGQNPNNGYRKVAIRLNGKGDIDLSVRISEFKEEINIGPISEWVAPEKTPDSQKVDYGFTMKINGIVSENKTYIPVLSEDKLPKLEFMPNDPTNHIEAEISNDIHKANIIRVYNNTKTMYKLYMIPYDTTQGIKEHYYNELEIKNFEVSSEPEPANIGINMFDNDFTTRWTVLSTGEWAVFDLGEVVDVDAIAAAFWLGNVRIYSCELYFSEDGIHYTHFKDIKSSGLTEDYEVYKFDRIKARFIKLVGQGNSANVNTNILELRILQLKEEFVQ